VHGALTSTKKTSTIQCGHRLTVDSERNTESISLLLQTKIIGQNLWADADSKFRDPKSHITDTADYILGL